MYYFTHSGFKSWKAEAAAEAELEQETSIDEEKAEKRRVYMRFYRSLRSSSSVIVYILSLLILSKKIYILGHITFDPI